MVGIVTGFAIHPDRVRLPRLPQGEHQLDELLGHLVPQVVLRQLLQAEVLRVPVLARRHDVPADPAAGEVVQRGHHARQHERRVERGARGRDHPEVLGESGQQRNQRQRVEFRRIPGVFQLQLGGSGEDVRHRQ
jgi:hypothetical protein